MPPRVGSRNKKKLLFFFTVNNLTLAFVESANGHITVLPLALRLTCILHFNLLYTVDPENIAVRVPATVT